MEQCKATSSDPGNSGDAEIRLVPNPEEFATDVTIRIAAGDALHGANVR